MRRTLKEKLDLISMELTTIRTMVSDLHSCLVPRTLSSVNNTRETTGSGSSHTKKDLSEAIRTLREYCDGQDSCKECVFRDCRDGYDCKIYELINDERYEEAVK